MEDHSDDYYEGENYAGYKNRKRWMHYGAVAILVIALLLIVAQLT